MRIKYIPSTDERISDFNNLIQNKYPQFLEEQDPEIILVCGGDGAMLHAIRGYKQHQVPFIGKGGGTLNFLMNKVEDDEAFLEALANEKLNLGYQRSRVVSASLHCADGRIIYLDEAVNDVVLGNDLMGWHHMHINSKDSSFQDFAVKGSGLCISTALGSTAYNFSNGGTVVPIESQLWSITGIVCDRWINDILMQQTVEIDLVKKSRDTVHIFLDGIKSEHTLDVGTKLKLTPGTDVVIAFIDLHEFMQRRIEICNRHRKQ